MRLNVILDRECTTWLDGQALEVRRTSGVALSRSELLRGVLAGLRKAGLDLSRCRTEQDVAWVVAFLFEALSGRRPPAIGPRDTT